MATRKRTHTRGPDIPEAQRHSVKLQVRMPPELAAAIQADSEQYDLPLARVLEAYRDLALTTGRLGFALYAQMVREERPEDYVRVVMGDGAERGSRAKD